MPKVLERLRTKLLGTLIDCLSTASVTEVYLISTGNLSLLPLPAAVMAQVAVVKQLPAAMFSLDRDERRRRRLLIRPLYGLANPDRGQNDLPGAELEVRSYIAGQERDAHVVFGGLATREFLLSALDQPADIHLACHASWSAAERQGPVLHLADGDISADEIMLRTPNPDLGVVVASACTSGLLDVQTSQEEAVGLATAFLAAGATGVITALWLVDDIASALLFSKFATLYGLGHKDGGQALAEAVNWLQRLSADEAAQALKRLEAMGSASELADSSGSERGGSKIRLALSRLQSERRPYAHPYFWACFVYTGS
jgi:CHAT domain-containing protein